MLFTTGPNSQVNRLPAGRNVHGEDIAAAIAWICSTEAPMLVGQTVHLDGGFADDAWRAVLGG